MRVIGVEIIALLFVVLFVYAATSKLIDVQKFRVELQLSPMLTDHARGLSWGVPAVEILLCALLLFPAVRRLGLWLAFSLMILFSAYIIAITQFTEDIPCSCGGILQNMTWNQHLVFNLCAVAVALFGLILLTTQNNYCNNQELPKT